MVPFPKIFPQGLLQLGVASWALTRRIADCLGRAECTVGLYVPGETVTVRDKQFHWPRLNGCQAGNNHRNSSIINKGSWSKTGGRRVVGQG